jgi:hypothetical protein
MSLVVNCDQTAANCIKGRGGHSSPATHAMHTTVPYNCCVRPKRSSVHQPLTLRFADREFEWSYTVDNVKYRLCIYSLCGARSERSVVRNAEDSEKMSCRSMRYSDTPSIYNGRNQIRGRATEDDSTHSRAE